MFNSNKHPATVTSSADGFPFWHSCDRASW